jgi:hypothetical protein
MLIMSFMLGEAGISCLEMPGEAMNLNRLDRAKIWWSRSKYILCAGIFVVCSNSLTTYLCTLLMDFSV